MGKLTDATYERMARRYLENLGANPEQMVKHGAEPNADGSVNAVLLQSPLWRIAITDVKTFYAMHEAVTYTYVEHEPGDGV